MLTSVETFLLRLWQPDPAEPAIDGALRGTLIHVPSGLATTFQNDSELLEFVRQSVGELQNHRGDGRRSVPITRTERQRGHR